MSTTRVIPGADPGDEHQEVAPSVTLTKGQKMEILLGCFEGYAEGLAAMPDQQVSAGEVARDLNRFLALVQ